MTIESRIRRLERVEDFSTKPVRGIMYVCEEQATEAYTLTVGKHTELIERNQGESQTAFDERANKKMESFYKRDKNAPIAILQPVLTETVGADHDSQ